MRPALALLAGTLLLALPASGASALAAGGGALTIAGVSVQPQTLSATLGWSTSVPARAVVQLGLTPDLGIWSKRLEGRNFRLALGSLEPSTPYRYRIVAAPVGSGGPAVSEGSFTTQGLPPWSGSTTVGDRLFVDHQPFFPRMAFKPCPYQVDGALAAGLNLFLGSGCGGDGALLQELRGRAYAAVDEGQRSLTGRGVVGWYLPDEADEHGGAAGLPTLPSSRQSRRVSFLTLTGHFYSGAAPPPGGRGIYPAFVAKAEMVGFDLYPMTGWCKRRFADVAYAQREMVALAAGKPTFQWIETGAMSGCSLFVPTAQTVTLETWLAIEGGAHGIGFFPTPEGRDVGAAVAGLSRTIAALSPALLAPALAVAGKPATIVASARSLNGALYVIASNPSVRLTARRARLSVPGLRARSVSVYGESRVLPVVDGVIRDAFAPMATHVYVAAPPGAPQA